MKAENGGPLPIVDIKNGNKLLGVITFKDLVCRVLAEGRDAVKTKAIDILSHQKQFCKADDSIGRAITLMDQYHVTELPVVDSNLRLIGTIHQHDITKHLEDPEIPLDPASIDEIMQGEHEIRTIL